ncbi:MAG: CoA-binding protein [Hyphomicrobiaceae bacterium]|nr:CoA-binding protein [Hyphomicrobiaceae bacterium]
MNHDVYDDGYIAEILAHAKTIALVGASANAARPSYTVMGYLLAKGYEVHPVNPGLEGKEIHGRLVYGCITDVPAPVDFVDVFRNAAAALEVTRTAIREKERLGIKTIWMQIGVRNDEAAAEAEAAGIRVVMNHCPKIEYPRLEQRIAELRAVAKTG